LTKHEIESFLPYRYELELLNPPEQAEKLSPLEQLSQPEQQGFKLQSGLTDAYARELIEVGKFKLENFDALVIGLERAALYYFFGKSCGKKILEQKSFPKNLRKVLATPKRGRQEQYGDRGIVWVMSIVWEFFGKHAGTAYDGALDKDRDSLFQAFVKGWIEKIDPDRPDNEFPSRKLFRTALKKMKNAI
jgi:hypothetical protein